MNPMTSKGPGTMRGRARAAMLVGVMAVSAAGFAGWRMMRAEPAPAVTYALIDGGRLAQHELKGKVVLVNFWATSCVTCIKEMPALADTYRKFQGRGFETVAVAMAYDRPDYVLNYASTRQLPFKVALDTQGQVAAGFGDVTLTPTSFLIGRDGMILERWVGEPDFTKLHAKIERQLAGS